MKPKERSEIIKHIKEKELYWIPIFILYLAIFFLCVFIIESYKILDWGLYIWGLGLGVALNIIIYIILPLLSSIFAKWNKGGYRHLNEGISYIFWFPMILIGIVTLISLNVFLDNSNPVRHEVKILNKWYESSCIDILSADDIHGARQRPYIRVISWREEEISIDLEVRKSVYDAIGKSWTLAETTLAVTTHEGFLGWEWVVSIEPIKKI